MIAPSVAVTAVGLGEVFDVPPGSADTEAVGGGWFGYLSYPDAGADGLPPRIPEAAGGWTDCVLRLRPRRAMVVRKPFRRTASGVGRPTRCGRAPAPRDWTIAWGDADRDAHRSGVLACLEAIAAGEVYQACVCTQFVGRLDGALRRLLRRRGGAHLPRAGGVSSPAPWGAVASLSPELFLRRCGEDVMSSPIKGTLPRHADPSALRASVKDVAENIMIVDLVRNDLSRVAVTGSVTVPELLAVRPAPGVWHLVSTVTAQVDVEVPMAAVLDAAFPPASVTGTPKTRARQLLVGWEPHRRGVYCGTVGLASPVAGSELNVAIRTVEFDADGSAVLGVGGGITADSDPDREWDECLHKAAPVFAAMSTAGSAQSVSRPAASAH